MGNRGPGRGLSLVRSWPLRTGQSWTRPWPLDHLARGLLPRFRIGKLRSREVQATQEPSELIFILTGSRSGPHSWDRRGGCGCRLTAAGFGPGSRWARLLTAWPLLQQTGWASSAHLLGAALPQPAGGATATRPGRHCGLPRRPTGRMVGGATQLGLEKAPWNRAGKALSRVLNAPPTTANSHFPAPHPLLTPSPPATCFPGRSQED